MAFQPRNADGTFASLTVASTSPGGHTWHDLSRLTVREYELLPPEDKEWYEAASDIFIPPYIDEASL